MLAETLANPTIVERAIRPNPMACPNCDVPALDAKGSLFCSELCNQEASLIRYVRRAISDGRVADVDVLRDGIGTPLLMLRSGGYPTRERTVPAATRRLVIARDGSRCQLCGADGANEIDHIRGSSNDATNLRLTCRICNGDRVRDGAVIIEDPEILALANAQITRLAQRIAADTSLRICDDEVNWSTAWRTYRKLQPLPPPIPALCEFAPCKSAPSVSVDYPIRCHTCHRALCTRHAISKSGGPPGHRETDTYCPDHAGRPLRKSSLSRRPTGR